MSKPEFVYVIYIASTPEKVFAALTDAKMSEQYWAGNRIVSDWKIGAAFALKSNREGPNTPEKGSNIIRRPRPPNRFHPHPAARNISPPPAAPSDFDRQKVQTRPTSVP